MSRVILCAENVTDLMDDILELRSCPRSHRLFRAISIAMSVAERAECYR